MPVKKIVAKDVPMAICTKYESSNPKIENINTKTGTIIIPPPTPNIPASMPANEPTKRYARSSTNI
jgi:hypothetical protein